MSSQRIGSGTAFVNRSADSARPDAAYDDDEILDVPHEHPVGTLLAHSRDLFTGALTAGSTRLARALHIQQE